MVTTGDEVLDYRLALTLYRDSPTHIQLGGNHLFEEFKQMLPEIFRFFDLYSLT